MALKKSQLYSSLWQSCDELRGGMDASQYKDYILTLLFIRCCTSWVRPWRSAAVRRFTTPTARFTGCFATA